MHLECLVEGDYRGIPGSIHLDPFYVSALLGTGEPGLHILPADSGQPVLSRRHYTSKSSRRTDRRAGRPLLTRSWPAVLRTAVWLLPVRRVLLAENRGRRAGSNGANSIRFRQAPRVPRRVSYRRPGHDLHVPQPSSPPLLDERTRIDPVAPRGAAKRGRGRTQSPFRR
jgi:hypothetical protein